MAWDFIIHCEKLVLAIQCAHVYVTGILKICWIKNLAGLRVGHENLNYGAACSASSPQPRFALGISQQVSFTDVTGHQGAHRWVAHLGSNSSAPIIQDLHLLTSVLQYDTAYISLLRSSHMVWLLCISLELHSQAVPTICLGHMDRKSGLNSVSFR